LSVDFKRYSSAEITVVWIHNKLEDEHTNIFSVVELIPAEQELSRKIGDGEQQTMRRSQLNSIVSIYATRLYVNINDALEFFGSESISCRNIKIDSDSLSIQSVSALTTEPSENNFVLVPPNIYPETPLGNVLPRRSVSSRVCVRLDTNSMTLKMFSDNDRIKVSAFVDEILGVDFIKYSEFFGAIILSCPNPYIRKFNERLSQDSKKFIYEIFERKGQSIIGGEIEISEERPSGKGFLIREIIKKNKGMIYIPYKPDEVRTRVFSKEKELIEDISGHFCQSINISMNVIGKKREIHMYDQENGTEKVDTVNVITDQIESIVGDKVDVKTPTMILNEKEKHRVMDALKAQREFIYFPGKTKGAVESARQILREIISKASERCMIVDPYLSGQDVLKFGLFVSSAQVEIRLISSAAFLIQEANEEYVEKTEMLEKMNTSDEQSEDSRENGKSVSANPVSYGEKLSSIIQQLMQKDKTLRLKCRVLKGRKKSPVHDRFLIVDDEVYILGSSLNEFASRATTLFKVPDPRVIIGEAEKWWKDTDVSIELDQWLTGRQ